MMMEEMNSVAAAVETETIVAAAAGLAVGIAIGILIC